MLLSYLKMVIFLKARSCVPYTSVCDFLIWELHARGLASHFGRDKTIALVEDRIYWPSLKKDVVGTVSWCRRC